MKLLVNIDVETGVQELQTGHENRLFWLSPGKIHDVACMFNYFSDRNDCFYTDFSQFATIVFQSTSEIKMNQNILNSSQMRS